MMRGSAG